MAARTLRAKIDMASPNLNLRDPVMYRILRATHHRTGDNWCIYPMYDYAHGQSDSIERITHSICTLEFEDHRPLYNWFIEQLGIFPSQQIEFDRLNVTYTLLSKRKLLQLVQEGHVTGWDDPRMPTISGIRRRGYTPEALRNFCAAIGASKTNGIIELAMLEHCVREDLNRARSSRDGRAAAAEGRHRQLSRGPGRGASRSSTIPRTPAPGRAKCRSRASCTSSRTTSAKIRRRSSSGSRRGAKCGLRGGYFIKCAHVVKDATGAIIEVHCTYDPETRSGNAPDGRKVKATIHWVSAVHAVDAEVRLYENLFLSEDPNAVEAGKTFLDNLNPNSLEVLPICKLEPSLAKAEAGDRFQFERLGYFCVDPDTTEELLVFNRTVQLRDSWAKIESRDKAVGAQ